MNKEMMRVLWSVKGKTSPTLSFDSYGYLVRNNCILHLYLMHVEGVGEKLWTSSGCLGGGICRELQKKLGLEESSHCLIIHNNVYNLVKNNREIRI